ncbi:MAG: cory-CC-star protein [Oleiphilaceae bacterium]|nr:cory-CC-star protein [Oleiphilaceae bacterium]
MDWLRRRWRQINEVCDNLYVTPYRRTARRARRREDDLFRLLLMSEALGIPNPASFYTLEMLPFLMEDFHEWHKRMGMDHSPLEGFRCC